MLRLAVRSTRRHVPAVVHRARNQSTTSNVPPSNVGASSSAKNTESSSQTSDDTLTVLKSLARKKNMVPNDLADPTEALPQHVVPKVAETDAELFGNQQQFNHHVLGLKHNPTELPIKRTLDPWTEAYTEEEYAMTLVHGRSVSEPFFHPRTHDVPVANIHFRSHHVQLLNLFTHFATHAASSLGIPTSRVVALPTKRTLWTVLRSPFAHKKSQENFERRVHKRAIKAWDADPEVVQRWIAYLRTHALAGVGMKVTTWDRVPLSVGSAQLVYRNEEMVNPLLDTPKKIQQLSQKIYEEESGRASGP